jgi:phosphoribosylanthranilate isomerase
MWVKICGNTNLEDALLAVEGGADAVGFVFAPSPRQVDSRTVRRIVAGLPDGIERYGVFVDSNLVEIVATVTECGLTGVQLHRYSDGTLPLRLRQHFARLPVRLSILRVLHYQAGGGTDPEAGFDQELIEASSDEAVDGFLVDSRNAKALGGSGMSFDWQGARTSFLRAAPRLRLIAAGGLSPENVKEAIETLRPWGVDAVSGVETAPGKKDRARVLAFIRSARATAAEMPVASRQVRGTTMRKRGSKA